MPTTVPTGEHLFDRIDACHSAIDALNNILGELYGRLDHDPDARGELQASLGVVLGPDQPATPANRSSFGRPVYGPSPSRLSATTSRSVTAGRTRRRTASRCGSPLAPPRTWPPRCSRPLLLHVPPPSPTDRPTGGLTALPRPLPHEVEHTRMHPVLLPWAPNRRRPPYPTAAAVTAGPDSVSLPASSRRAL